jgi:hypothetical protein
MFGNVNMNFTEKQKQAIKERDGFLCQLNKRFGIEELTGVPCSDNLEVHHKRYCGKQRLFDGVTICVRCHEMLTEVVRRIRYGNESKVFFDYISEELWRHL